MAVAWHVAVVAQTQNVAVLRRLRSAGREGEDGQWRVAAFNQRNLNGVNQHSHKVLVDIIFV